MTGINKSLVSNYKEFVKDGKLDSKELSELKKVAKSAKNEPQAIADIKKEIGSEINVNEYSLLFSIGTTIENKTNLEVLKSSVNPANKEISQLFEKGFNSKSLSDGNEEISRLPTSEKLTKTLQESVNYLPAEIKDKVSSLLTPENLQIMTATLGVHVASHAVGVGQVADVMLLSLGIAAVGLDIKDGLIDLTEAVKGSLAAKNNNDIDSSAKLMAKGLATLIVDAPAVIALNKGVNSLGKINPPANTAYATVGGYSKSLIKNSTIDDSGIFLAKKSKTVGSNGYIHVKNQDIKALQNGGKNTVVTVKSKAEAEALVKKAFPDYKEVDSFGSVTKSEFEKFPSVLKSELELRWKKNPNEEFSISKADKEKLPKDLRNEIESRWFKNFEEFDNGGAWHKDYSLVAHPIGKAGHGEYPHINIRHKEHNLEIRIMEK